LQRDLRQGGGDYKVVGEALWGDFEKGIALRVASGYHLWGRHGYNLVVLKATSCAGGFFTSDVNLKGQYLVTNDKM